MSRPRDYPRLPIEAFGEELLRSGDLDPVYVSLARVEWTPAQMNRWLVAYWCTYHCGVSCWLSEHEGLDFFHWLNVAAANQIDSPVGGKWPRAPERRHWRAENALACVRDLRERYGARPEDMVDFIVDAGTPINGPMTLKFVTDRVERHVGFGPWIAFKVADMVERVLGFHVLFTDDDVMYDSPTKAALELWRIKSGVGPEARIKDEAAAVRTVVDYLLEGFGTFNAPPRADRPVGLQEVETILCKWASHRHGHYPLGNDLREIREGTLPWLNVSGSARDFLHWFPGEDQPTALAPAELAGIS